MKNYQFDGSISEEVLCNYLSHAVTHTGFGMDNYSPSRTFDDDLRMLLHEGTKFVGRAGLIWEGTPEEEHFAICKERADITHKADPDIILQGCIFEWIQRNVLETIPIPAWVFEEFGLPVEQRNFGYEAMMAPGWCYRDHWAFDCSVPDITQIETQMYFFYRAKRYIDSDFEALHFGQVHLIGADDKDFACWYDLVGRIRRYAKKHARRHYVLCDAHTHGISRNGEMLFDYNAWPIRLKEVEDQPMKCVVEEGYLDSIFGRSMGGKSPSGWSTDTMPFFVEVDNFGVSDFAGQPRHDSYYAWGYDEITWFSMLSREERTEFLRYLWNWVTSHYPKGFVEMPSRRCLGKAIEHIWEHPNTAWLDEVAKDEFLTYTLDEQGRAHIFRRYYSANNPSDACPFGFGEEDVIAECFHKQDEK